MNYRKKFMVAPGSRIRPNCAALLSIILPGGVGWILTHLRRMAAFFIGLNLFTSEEDDGCEP